jgi:hypothetical protein
MSDVAQTNDQVQQNAGYSPAFMSRMYARQAHDANNPLLHGRGSGSTMGDMTLPQGVGNQNQSQSNVNQYGLPIDKMGGVVGGFSNPVIQRNTALANAVSQRNMAAAPPQPHQTNSDQADRANIMQNNPGIPTPAHWGNPQQTQQMQKQMPWTSHPVQQVMGQQPQNNGGYNPMPLPPQVASQQSTVQMRPAQQPQPGTGMFTPEGFEQHRQGQVAVLDKDIANRQLAQAHGIAPEIQQEQTAQTQRQSAGGKPEYMDTGNPKRDLARYKVELDNWNRQYRTENQQTNTKGRLEIQQGHLDLARQIEENKGRLADKKLYAQTVQWAQTLKQKGDASNLKDRQEALNNLKVVYAATTKQLQGIETSRQKMTDEMTKQGYEAGEIQKAVDKVYPVDAELKKQADTIKQQLMDSAKVNPDLKLNQPVTPEDIQKYYKEPQTQDEMNKNFEKQFGFVSNTADMQAESDANAAIQKQDGQLNRGLQEGLKNNPEGAKGAGTPPPPQPKDVYRKYPNDPYFTPEHIAENAAVDIGKGITRGGFKLDVEELRKNGGIVSEEQLNKIAQQWTKNNPNFNSDSLLSVRQEVIKWGAGLERVPVTQYDADAAMYQANNDHEKALQILREAGYKVEAAPQNAAPTTQPATKPNAQNASVEQKTTEGSEGSIGPTGETSEQTIDPNSRLGQTLKRLSEGKSPEEVKKLYEAALEAKKNAPAEAEKHLARMRAGEEHPAMNDAIKRQQEENAGDYAQKLKDIDNAPPKDLLGQIAKSLPANLKGIGKHAMDTLAFEGSDMRR